MWEWILILFSQVFCPISPTVMGITYQFLNYNFDIYGIMFIHTLYIYYNGRFDWSSVYIVTFFHLHIKMHVSYFTNCFCITLIYIRLTAKLLYRYHMICKWMGDQKCFETQTLVSVTLVFFNSPYKSVKIYLISTYISLTFRVSGGCLLYVSMTKTQRFH